MVWMNDQHQILPGRRILSRMGRKALFSMGILFILLFIIINLNNVFKSNGEIKSSVLLSSSSIGMFIVANDKAINEHKQHVASLACYAYRHSYQFILIHPKQHPVCLNMSGSIYFQKHCLVSMYLLEHVYIQWLLVLDIDVLVLNMSKKIESYLPNANTESSIYLILYERFNGEIAAGNYLIRNHPWSRAFLLRWLEYERRIIHIKFHNSDNGALHLHLLDDMVGNVSQSMYNRCFQIYRTATGPDLYHTYIGCCKCALGGRWQFQHLRISRRGHAFVRDNLGHDSNKRIWSPTDFLLHGQKKNLGAYYSKEIDIYQCVKPQWKLPVREDVMINNYTKVKEIIGRFDQAAARAYPQSVGLPDISECWPHCIDTEKRRQAFVEKVCNKNAS